MFRPGGPLRAEHAPRPADVRNRRSRLCCTTKGGPPLRAGPPFLDMPDKSGQAYRRRGERAPAGRAEAGRRERGTMQRVGQEEGFGEVKGERRGEVVAARGRLNVRVESAGVVGFEREYWKEQAASSPQAGVDARLLVLVLALLPSSPLYRPSPAAGTDRFSGSIARRATPISWNACDTCNCCTTLFRSWLTLRQPDPTTSRRSRS